jgi:hypothetical protein
MQAVAPFMAQHFGPMTGCRFNELHTGRSLGTTYGELGHLLEGTRVIEPAAGCSDRRQMESTFIAHSCVPAGDSDA